MAGLLQQGMGPQAQPSPQAGPGQAPQQPPQQPPQGQGGDPRVDMEPGKGEQQRDVLVEAMLTPLYEEMLEPARQILEQNADDPPQGIARILAKLMLTAWQALADQGKTVPPGVMVQAAMVAAQAIGDMAVKLGILPEQYNGKPIEAGFMLAMAQFGQATREAMPPEQRRRYQELLTSLKEGKAMSQGQQSQPQQPPQGQPPQVAPADPRLQGGV